MAQIYTFWSVNGGVGKTTISSTISHKIAKENKNLKVALLDFNLVNPDIDLHLGVKAYDMKNILTQLNTNNLNFTTINMYLKEHPKCENLKIMTGMYDINYFDKFKMEHFVTILTVIKEMDFDLIFIDIDSALNIDSTFVALTMADKVINVTNASIPAIRNLNRYIQENLSRINIDDNKIDIIVNRFNPSVTSETEIKHYLGRNNIFFIDYSMEVEKAVNESIPVSDIKNKKTKKINMQIEEISKVILGRL